MSDKICDFRLEAEYYSKIYEKLGVNLTKNHLVELSTLVKSKIITGHTPSMKNEKFYGGKINFIKTDNLRDNFIKEPFSDYLSELGDEKIKNSRLKEFDIITTIIGATYKIIGRSCLVNTTMLPSNINQNIALIRADIKKINPYYLNVYMQSLYGKLYLHWLSRQTEQVNLNCEEVGKLKVARFSNSFEESLAALNKKSYGLNIISNEKYSKAENLLISELELENFNPSNEKISIKTLKESFLKTGRLDSEYYQPKYDDYLKKVFSYSNGYELLGKCCNIKDKNFIPKDDEEYRYIELANVRSNAQITDCNIWLGKELPTRARRKVNTGDVIVSSIEGSLESCALITKEYNNSLCSTGFYVVNSEKLNSESLLTVFKSSLMLNLMKKGCSGIILTNIAKEEFAKLPIPFLKQGVQDEIASYIKQSMGYSKKVKELLEISTKSVEIAIEKDEQTAQNFLDRQTLIAYYNEQASYYINLATFRLYEEIGLLDSLKSANYTVKNLKDTFGISGRLDSEYYQEKYDILFEKLSDNNCDKLSNLVTIKKSIEPGSESYQTKGTPFIRVQDLTKFGLTDTSIYLSENEFKDCIRPKKDTILLSKDGTVGIAYKMNKDEDIITSSAILHLDVKDERVLPDYLTLVLNSIAVKMQAEKDAGGSIINHWKKSEIENVIIPIITKEKQEQISKLLIESENLRSESKSILEKAVKSVEMAIEYGEEKAIVYLNA